MSLVQNCTKSKTCQGFNAKADDHGQLTHQMCSRANFQNPNIKLMVRRAGLSKGTGNYLTTKFPVSF